MGSAEVKGFLPPDLEPFLAGETNLYTLRGNDPVNYPREPDIAPRGLFPESAAVSQERLRSSRVVPFQPEGPMLPGFRFRGIHRSSLEDRSFAADAQAVESILAPIPWASRSNPRAGCERRAGASRDSAKWISCRLHGKRHAASHAPLDRVRPPPRRAGVGRR